MEQQPASMSFSSSTSPPEEQCVWLQCGRSSGRTTAMTSTVEVPSEWIKRLLTCDV